MNERDTTDERLWAALEASLAGRALAALRSRLDAARPASTVAGAWMSVFNEWRAAGPLVRIRAIGAGLIAAVVVHAALMLSVHPGDLWWTIVPALVAAFGITVTALSFAGPNRH